MNEESQTLCSVFNLVKIGALSLTEAKSQVSQLMSASSGDAGEDTSSVSLQSKGAAAASDQDLLGLDSPSLVAGADSFGLSAGDDSGVWNDPFAEKGPAQPVAFAAAPAAKSAVPMLAPPPSTRRISVVPKLTPPGHSAQVHQKAVAVQAAPDPFAVQGRGALAPTGGSGTGDFPATVQLPPGPPRNELELIFAESGAATAALPPAVGMAANTAAVQAPLSPFSAINSLFDAAPQPTQAHTYGSMPPGEQ